MPPRCGSTVIQVGPNEPKADLQVPFIKDLTTQKVNAIIISADGKDEVAPDLKAAMAAGIKVVGFDSSPAVGAYNVFVNQVDFSGVGVNLADWACELAPNCTGEIAILSAAATATNQNEWIDLMKKTLSTDAKYKGLKLVDTVYGDDKPDVSTTQAQGLLTKYPNLKVIVAPTTVGILAAAQVVSAAKKSDSVKVTGLGFPNDMKPFVKDGTSPVFGLWSVPDLGYLAEQVAEKLVSGEIKGTEGETFTVKGLNDDKPYTIGKDSIVVLGPAFRFDTTNVDELQLLGRQPRPADAIEAPGATLPGLFAFRRDRRWNVSGSRCASCPGRRPNTVGGTPTSGRRCSTRFGRRGARLLDLHPRRPRCSRTSRSTTSTRSGRSMAAAPVNDRWQAEMASLHRPADGPGDRVPPAPRGDLPPRLTQPRSRTSPNRSASQRILAASWKPAPPSWSLNGYSTISFGPPYSLNAP